jgi:hypothetical protein
MVEIAPVNGWFNDMDSVYVDEITAVLRQEYDLTKSNTIQMSDVIAFAELSDAHKKKMKNVRAFMRPL